VNAKEEKFLIGRIIEGDTDAFRSFINEYKNLVTHIVFRMIGGKNVREDLCQDVFLKVYDNLKDFRFQSKVSTWVARIAYNRCINHLEKKRVPLFDDLHPQDASIESFSSDPSLPDKAAETKDLQERLREEIQKLPVKFKTIITLYHLDELNYAEIGEVMQLPEGTVKSHLFRARKHLKEQLTKKYQKEELYP